MSITEMWTKSRNRLRFNLCVAGEAERYRRYHEEKSKIPMDLPPKEYEAEVKRLAKKYKI